MEQNELHPELREYIFQYSGKYFWQEESKAHLHLHALAKSNNGMNVAMYKFFIKDNNILDNPKIKKLVNDGFETFKIKITDRIWNEHKSELELNLCPMCNKITRTPRAKQCQFCFQNWH